MNGPIALMRDLLDRHLGRVTMYRLVTLLLLALAVIAVGYTAFGSLGDGLWTVQGQVTSLAVLVVSVGFPSWVIAKALRTTAHLESSVITALLLFFLFVPQEGGIKLGWIALAGVLAGVSKFAIAWRGRHVLNPAAAGAFAVFLVQRIADVDSADRHTASWWVASADLLPWVAMAAFLVLWRTRHVSLGLLFVVLAVLLTVLGIHQFGTPYDDATRMMLEASPVIFFAGFMLSEPLTLPPRQYQQWIVGVVMAVVYAYPLAVLMFTKTPDTFFIDDQWQVAALLIGNLVAFGFARRHGLAFTVKERVAHGAQTYEWVLAPRRRLRFEPGQYAELHVPHRGPDGRGSRRMFSVASAPDHENVSFGLRVPDSSSSFKSALDGLKPGDTVRSTGIWGDFLLPANPLTPVALVAGGIGITPFLSQLADLRDRDAVLVYGVASGAEIPFRDRLSTVRTVIVSPDRPADLPAIWTWIESPVLTPDVVAAAVPDLAQRHAYVSGPPAMVNSLRPALKRQARKVHTDYFSGY